MDYFEELRPVLSGVVGAGLATFFCALLDRWMPKVCNGKSAWVLLHENRVGIFVANASIFLGFVAAIFVYGTGVLPQTDWRGFALTVGTGVFLVLLVLPLFSLLQRTRPSEAYIAYAISQKLPPIILYVMFTAMLTCYAVAVSSFLA